MPVLKNVRHETFCQHIATSPTTGMSIAQAYISSGYRATGHSAEANASRLLKDAEVAARIAEILAPVARQTQVSVRSLLLELQQTIEDARKDGQHSVVVASLALSAKLVGLLRDKLEDAPSLESSRTREDLFRRLLNEFQGDPGAVVKSHNEFMAAFTAWAGDRARLIN